VPVGGTAFGLALTLFLASTAGAGDRPAPVPLWPAGAPGAQGTQSEDVPALALYRADPAKSTGTAIVVCPGGSYQRLADHEGPVVAEWLNTIGVTAGVLRYRLGPRYHHPAPLLDAARAVRTMRARAAEWGIDAHRVGIMGFSAGGHLASTLATHFDDGDPSAADPIDRLGSRPDVAIVAYPVVSMEDPIAHTTSRRNLLGENPSPELVELLSNEKHVTARTPPVFVFQTNEDTGVVAENSLRLVEALRKAGVPVEMHLFEKGRHGVGLAQDDPALRVWPALLENWLRVRGFLGK